MDGEFEVGRCKLLHLEGISNEVLLYSTEIYVQPFGLEHDERWYGKKKKERVYMYDWITLLFSRN